MVDVDAYIYAGTTGGQEEGGSRKPSDRSQVAGSRPGVWNCRDNCSIEAKILEAEYELAKTQGLIALCHAQFVHEHQIKLESQNSLINQDYDNLYFDYPLPLDSEQQQQQSTLFGNFNDESYYTSIIS